VCVCVCVCVCMCVCVCVRARVCIHSSIQYIYMYIYISVRFFWRHLGELREFRAGCSKTAEIIPSSTANHTNRAERCNAQTRRAVAVLIHRIKRDATFRTGFWDSTALQDNPIRNVSLKKSNPTFNEKN
jgi:hypothetical protein